jgi:hypothetical protein
MRLTVFDAHKLSTENFGCLVMPFASATVRIATFLGIGMHYLFFICLRNFVQWIG